MNKWQRLLINYLCPPGSGVYTVHTGQERRQALQTQLYPGATDVTQQWQDSLQQLPKTIQPIVLGISSDVGGGIQRGANWGPLYVRQAIYQQQPDISLFELGDVRVIPQLLLDDYVNETTRQQCRQALYGDPNSHLAVSPLSIAYEVARELYQVKPEAKLFTIGGDHSCSYPVIKAYLEAKQVQQQSVAVIHFDAHTDLLSQRLGIDICFGSWTYHILDLLPQRDHLIQLGIRSTGYDKSHWEKTLGIKQYWAQDIHQQGAQVIVEQVVTQLQQQGVTELYVTFDIDALDANTASATGTPEDNGLQVDEAIIMIEYLAKHFTLSGADMMEVAPLVNESGEADVQQKTLTAAAQVSIALLTALAKTN